ncbi:unnamed protein product, partial [Staurois parvus]
QGRDLCCFAWLCIAVPYKALCLQWKALTKHTVNPLIAPDVNHFLPMPFVQYQCFLLALITVFGVTGDVSDAKSVSPSVRMPAEVPL